MITISIDLRLIDQSRCKKTVRKNGEAATFCDLVLIETPDGKFGDYAVKQDSTKEEREAGVKMPFVGNGKIRGGSSSRPQGEHSARPKPAPQRRPPERNPDLDAEEPDSIPF